MATATPLILDFKQRLQRAQPCVGAWLTAPSPQVADAMVSLGFHWLGLELEHALFSEETAAHCITVGMAARVPTFARLPQADPLLARRLFDYGCAGVIVPATQSADEFAAFAARCLYPPQGKRGVALTRSNDWGARFAEDLATFQPILIPQIETRKGCDNADAIAALPYVDAIFMGPWDLSADLGHGGQFDTPEFLDAMGKVKTACRKNNKQVGTHIGFPSCDELQRSLDDGYRLIAYSTDLIALRQILGDAVETFQAFEKSNG